MDELVRPYRERYTESRGREPAHVTLLNPFLPEEEMDEEVEARIERVVGGFPAFEFQATEVTSFGWRGVYLAPEPVRLFVRLIQRLMEAFPETQPYWKAYGGEIVPHITVAADADRLGDIAFSLSPYLPIRCSAHEVTHLAIRPSEPRWEALGRYPLS